MQGEIQLDLKLLAVSKNRSGQLLVKPSRVFRIIWVATVLI